MGGPATKRTTTTMRRNGTQCSAGGSGGADGMGGRALAAFISFLDGMALDTRYAAMIVAPATYLSPDALR
jgi:hypothetical protein